jgi:hypothetical protein
VYNGSGGFLSLPLPVGASITDVTATAFKIAAAPYALAFYKYTQGPTGDASTSLKSAPGAIAFGTHNHDLTPTATETVELGERFVVSWGSGATSSSNALCGVTVTYQLPGG